MYVVNTTSLVALRLLKPRNITSKCSHTRHMAKLSVESPNSMHKSQIRDRQSP